MKKFLSIMGAVFLVLVAAAAIAGGYAFIHGKKLDADSRAYVEATLPKLMPDFTPDNFLSFVAPELKDQADRAALEKFTSDVKAKLGAYKSYEDLKGEALVTLKDGQKIVSGRYFAKMIFEKASPMAQIILINGAQGWSLARIDFRDNEPPASSVAPATASPASPAGAAP